MSKKISKFYPKFRKFGNLIIHYFLNSDKLLCANGEQMSYDPLKRHYNSKVPLNIYIIEFFIYYRQGVSRISSI